MGSVPSIIPVNESSLLDACMLGICTYFFPFTQGTPCSAPDTGNSCASPDIEVTDPNKGCGQSATYSCKTGYMSDDQMTIHCNRSSGLWLSHPPFCYSTYQSIIQAHDCYYHNCIMAQSSHQVVELYVHVKSNLNSLIC